VKRSCYCRPWEYAAKRKQRRILSLFGTIDYDPSYDYKRERTRKK
jgi:hypothetical protein